MDLALTPDQTKLQETCRALAREFATRAADHDRDATAPLADYAALRDAGLYSLLVPKEYGGWGGGFVDYAIAAEELAQGSAATALSFNMHCIILALVYKAPLPVPQAVKQDFADLANGGKLICGLLTEAGHSGYLYSTRACTTVARRTADGYVLDGRKTFATMVEAADYACIFARPADGDPESAVPVLLPLDTPGITIERVWDTLGMRATRSDTVVLDHCVVPADAVVEALLIPDIGAFMRDFEGLINLPYTAVYLGVGVAALREGIAVAQRRTPPGYEQPVGYLPDVRRRVAIMSAELEAARRLLHYAAWLFDSDAEPREALTALLKAKYVVGEAVARATRSALELGGGNATFKGSVLERLFRDGATATIMPPHSDVCLAQLSVHELDLDPAQIVAPLRRRPAGVTAGAGGP